MQASCIGHWIAMIRILTYLQKALGQEMLYEDEGNIQISSYCDAN